MTAHSVQLSEKTYARLVQQAARLNTTPEDVLERVLAGDLLLATDAAEPDEVALDEPEATTEALAAVRRLTTLFADLTLPNLDQLLDDPMLAVANSQLLNLEP